ncbi:extracellular solute-binding protein [Leucobacter chromiireducens]|uniref:extracellular solute-binding protein n=1 Tax=Leucobacter chromiireducens TaxID=283877 RepID=UPI003F80C86B
MKKAVSLIAMAGAVALALTGCSSGSAPESGSKDQPFAGQTIVVNSFGGDYEATLQEAVIEPFEAETGAKVEVVTAYSADALAQLTAQKGKPQLDVVTFSGGQEVVAAADGLLAPIAETDIEGAADLVPTALDGVKRGEGEGPVIQIAPMGLIYLKDQVKDAPTSWDAVLDPKFAGHVALTDFSNSYGLLTFLAMNAKLGGSTDDVQPGLDAVGGLLAKNDAVVTATSPEIQQAFTQRDIWLAPYAQDYAYTLTKAGLNVGFTVPENSPASYITANVVAGTGKEDLATAFVNYQLRPEVQLAWADALRYSPTNMTVEIPAEFAEEVIAGEGLTGLVRFDPTEIDAKRAEWVKAWNALVAS